MSNKEIDDLAKLIQEAQSKTYTPRAKRCWPWSHEWTMWQGRDSIYYDHAVPYRTWQVFDRHCVRCGLPKAKVVRSTRSP